MLVFAGVYERAEASRYLQVTAPIGRPPSYQAVYRWSKSGLPSLEAPPFLAFEELVSLRMVVAFRQAGFSLQHIHKVHEWLKEVVHYHRPFALKELWISETDIFVQMEERLLSASRRGQYTMGFVKDWLRSLGQLPQEHFDMDFKKRDGHFMASSWRPAPHVLLDPLVQFGAPCIEGTRIPTRAIWTLSLGGDSPRAIAKGYAMPLFKIEVALEWEKKLAGIVG